MAAKRRNLILIFVLAAAMVSAVVLTVLFSGTREPGLDERASVRVPILLYHHISEGGEGESTIDRELFLSHLDALAADGYETVSFRQLMDYVYSGQELPEKPVIINFDDGYSSNYEIAWPALVERDMRAAIFVIGVSVGKDTYKDTGLEMIPHFSYEQAREMIDSGAISIQPHTYDMHQYGPYEKGTAREGLLPMEGESEADYRMALINDLSRAKSELEENTSEKVYALAYPNGKYTKTSEDICSELEIPITLTTKAAANTIVKGDPGCLRLMNRYSIDDLSPQELLELIKEDG